MDNVIANVNARYLSNFIKTENSGSIKFDALISVDMQSSASEGVRINYPRTTGAVTLQVEKGNTSACDLRR